MECLKLEVDNSYHTTIIPLEEDCHCLDSEDVAEEECDECNGDGVKLTENGEILFQFILKYQPTFPIQR